MTERQLYIAIQRIENAPDLRKHNSAPKRVVYESVAEKMRQHAMEPVVVNKRKVERVIAMLEMLSERALKKKDVGAAREYLDRTIGKSAQPITADPALLEALERIRQLFGDEEYGG